MKNEIGFLCVGQAAGNIGVLFENYGYNVLFVNTSDEDLSLLKTSKHKYHVEGGEGCAKDRDRAKALLANDIDTLIEQVRSKLPQKLIFTIFASGGGTGSGLSPFLLGVLIDEFKGDGYEPEKRFAAITILPSGVEPLQPAINSYNCCKELLDIEELGAIFFIDNDTRTSKDAINKEFAEGLHKIISIPDKHSSTKGNVDRAEIKKVLFETPGMACFTVKESSCGNAALLIDGIKNSIFAPADTAGSVLYYVFSTTIDVDKEAIQREYGEPLDTFATYNDNFNIVLMTGMQPPYDRMQKIADRVENKKECISKSLDNSVDNRLGRTVGIDVNARKRKPNVIKKEVVDTNTGAKKTVTEKKPSARELLNAYKRG